MVQVGVIGFAHGHIFRFGSEWNKHPEYGVKLTCGFDMDAARGKDGCEKLGIQQVDTVENLLARPDVEAVVITSETLYHVDFVEMAAKAGKAIILYKPMALTMAQADRMVEAVERYQVPFTMGWQMRTDPQNQEVARMIKENTLGQTYYFRRRHSLETHKSEFEKLWHADPKLNRDIFADDSAHPIDWMHSIFGMPETVSCEMSTMAKPLVPNDVGVAVFKYANGLIAEISCCFVTTAAEITTEVYCDNGAIQQYFGDLMSTKLPHNHMAGLRWYKSGDADWHNSEIASPAVHAERLDWQAKPMADYLNGKAGPICSVWDGRDSLRLVLACYLSAREGCRVRIDDPRIYEI